METIETIAITVEPTDTFEFKYLINMSENEKDNSAGPPGDHQPVCTYPINKRRNNKNLSTPPSTVTSKTLKQTNIKLIFVIYPRSPFTDAGFINYRKYLDNFVASLRCRLAPAQV